MLGGVNKLNMLPLPPPWICPTVSNLNATLPEMGKLVDNM